MSAPKMWRKREGPSECTALVHPECRQEVVEQADYVGSKTGIIGIMPGNLTAENLLSERKNSIVEHLQFDCPDKSFYR